MQTGNLFGKPTQEQVQRVAFHHGGLATAKMSDVELLKFDAEIVARERWQWGH